jgi:hypothetical protein
MSAMTLEAYLARLYTDAAARERFLADPVGEARQAGLDEADAIAMRDIDQAGLRMAATSYANKRAQHRRPKKKLTDALMGWLGRR